MAVVNLALDLVANTTEDVTYRMKKFGFGDGYEQLSPDGIHPRQTSYQITTRPLNAADAESLEGALHLAARGDFLSIKLEPFSNETRLYRLQDSTYSRQFLRFSSNSSSAAVSKLVFSFTLIESFKD